jgi:phage terminase small subunit
MAKAGSKKIGGTTVQQKLFAIEYFKNGGNATLAAIEAGYSKKTATQTGSRLLTYVKVKEYLKKLTDELESRAIITKERVLEEYAKIGFFDLRTIYNENNSLKNIKDLDDVAGAAIAGIKVFEEFEGTGDERYHIGNTVEIKLNSKLSALDSIRDTMGWKAPTKLAATDPDGKAVSQKIQLSNGQEIDLS